MSQFLTLRAAEKQSKHILVVEDNSPLRFALAEWLRLLNYVVFEATSADEAVILLESALIVDLVITDVQMPGAIDGFDLAHYIHTHFPAINVIVVSATDFHKELTDKNIHFFRKPYNFDAISSHLAKLLADSNPKNESSNE